MSSGEQKKTTAQEGAGAGQEPTAGQASEDLTGLKANRDQILEDKKKLQVKYDKLLKSQEDASKKLLEEQNKFKELYELEQKKVENLGNEMQTLKQLGIFKDEAVKHGFKISYSKYHIDKAEFENGSMKNPADFFKTLQENEPGLFNIGHKRIETDPTKTTPFSEKGQAFTAEQIKNMSREEYKKNRDQIIKQAPQKLIMGESQESV